MLQQFSLCHTQLRWLFSRLGEVFLTTETDSPAGQRFSSLGEPWLASAITAPTCFLELMSVDNRAPSVNSADGPLSVEDDALHDAQPHHGAFGGRLNWLRAAVPGASSRVPLETDLRRSIPELLLAEHHPAISAVTDIRTEHRNRVAIGTQSRQLGWCLSRPQLRQELIIDQAGASATGTRW